MLNIYRGKIGRRQYILITLSTWLLFPIITLLGGWLLLTLFGNEIVENQNATIPIIYISAITILLVIWQHSLNIRRLRAMGISNNIFLIDLLPFGPEFRYLLLFFTGNKKSKK